MSYQVDQSGKIEQTSNNTVISISNSIHKTIILKAKDKRALLKIYQKAGKSTKAFTIQLFSALVYLLIEKSQIERGLVYIDIEYPGHEDIIKSYITQLITKRKKIKLNTENIRFSLVGKRSKAHLFGYLDWKKGISDFKATADDIEAMILNYQSKTEKRSGT